MNRLLLTSAAVALALLGISSSDASAQTPPRGVSTYVCDIAYEDCRENVLQLIRNETVGIDVSFWFMTDARYSNEIVKRWNLGVPVRVIMDPRANATKAANGPTLNQLQQAGIPMLNKPFGDIAHWKGMIFAGQNMAEFSGANYSPYEYIYEIPLAQYQDEAIYFSNEQDVVQSLMRRFDDVWTNDVYSFYANPIPRVRTYPTSFMIAPEFNLPPDDSYTNRLLPLLDAENQAIDVVMFRITDPRPADALIRAAQRGVPVRLYAEPLEYRNPARAEDSYNIDRMYMGGVQIKMRAHAGQNHQKTVRLTGQHTTVFGTSNWSTASDDNQLEVNYFTTKDWFYQFFADQFEWKWNNQPPDGSGIVQTTDFVPLPPDAPSYRGPANAATGVNPSSVTLQWYAGSWARKYDVYLGVGSNPPLYMANVNLGPSSSASDNKSITITGLLPGTTYSWKIVSKTMANIAAGGPLWSFTTSGTPPVDPPSDPGDTTPPSVVLASPANNATVSGTVQFSASAADNVSVAGVQFKVDGVAVGAEDRSGPFTNAWDSTTVANGTHTITAEARDSAGNRATSAGVTVTVSNAGTPPADTTAPTVSVTAPAAGATVTGTVTVTASAFDNVGVSGVQFKLDGANLGAEDTTAPYSVSWNTTSTTNGSHTLTATARDAAGNVATAANVGVTVSNVTTPPADTTGPVVSVSAPANAATVSATTTVSATASDNVGVAGVQFKLDGINLGAEDTTAPFAVAWDTTSATNGSHALTALARDAAGNTTLSAAVTVTVANTTTPPAPATIVLHAGNVPVANLHGNWIRSNDNTAAGGIAVWNIDNGVAKIAPAPVAPQHYVDFTFTAQANTAYHLWVRMRAQNDYFGNDSIHVQFSDAVNAANQPIYRIGSSGTDNSAQVVLQERDGGPISGWGWADQGWNGNGPEIYFAASGQHTLRIGQREDGTIIDQVVLSSDVYLTTAPGEQNHDNTILPATATPPANPGDTTAPAVAISAPANGATVSGTVTVSATSSDDTGVVGVQFKLDGVDLGAEDTSSPYSVSWNTTTASNGSHSLTAEARDAAGNTRLSSAVTVTVSNTVTPPPDTTSPTVSITAPSANTTVSGTTTVSASASDNVGVVGVQFKLDGVNLGAEDTTAPYSISWNTTAATNGSHTLTAVARDAAGNIKLSTGIPLTVSNTVTPPPDTTAPTVSVTAPAGSSTVSGARTVAATASDNIGVAGVQFKLDGVNLGAEQTSAPYSVSWDTTSASNGSHTLTALARDAAGNTTLSAPVTVTVSNGVVTVPRTIVIRASDALPQNIFGNWTKVTDNTAADGVAIWNQDNGIGKIVPAPVAPQHYVDITFNAEANRPYHLWVRMRAQNDYFGNDSIHVQFSDSVDAANAPIYRIGSTGTENSAQVVLQEVDAGPISGWGWADQGWNGLGPNIYFATSGPHTVRIQQREDGTIIDQIVLSSDQFLTAAPGPQNHDNTIVPR